MFPSINRKAQRAQSFSDKDDRNDYNNFYTIEQMAVFMSEIYKGCGDFRAHIGVRTPLNTDRLHDDCDNVVGGCRSFTNCGNHVPHESLQKMVDSQTGQMIYCFSVKGKLPVAVWFPKY